MRSSWLVCRSGLLAALSLSTAFAPGIVVAQGPAQHPSQPSASQGADDAAELAKKLQNPVAAMISVPLQSNYDWGAGSAGDGFKMLLNIQPVIPITLSKGWNLISRSILPVIYQNHVTDDASQGGLGDLLQSLFLSPAEPVGGWVLGVGPAFSLPTATNAQLGTQKWEVGPTAVVLRQGGGVTAGALVNHVWSFAGKSERQSVSVTFLQPFLSYTFGSLTTLTLNTETTYDWENERWTVPLNLTIAQLMKLGHLPLSLQLGGRYYAHKPANGPDWGLRFTVTFLLSR